MPEIRINNIPTTAASTASDDFFAIDGSNNNTRKMSAYSPTFGGNLTVSGTGNNVFRGPIRWGNTNWPGYNGYISEASTDSALIPVIARNLIGSTGSNYTIANGDLGYYSGFELGTDIRWFAASGTFTTGQSLVPTERMRLTYQGNLLLGATTDLNRLTVFKDAAGSDIGAGDGQVMIAGATNTNKRLAIGFNTTSDYGWLQAGIAGTAYKNIVLNNNGGNVLIGTTTDGGQKLQVNGTIYASSTITSGGMRLGQNDSGYGEVSWSTLFGTGNYALLQGSGGDTYLNSGTGQSLSLRTNGNTNALTLDSSQNATFAGNAQIGATYGGSQKKLEIIGGSYADGQTLRLADYSTAYGFDIVNDGVNAKLKIIRHSNSVGGTEAMSIDRDTGNATFAGSVTAADLTLGSSGPSVKSTLSARAPRQGLVFDGTAANVAISSLPAFSTRDFTVSIWANPSNVSGAKKMLSGSANSFEIGLENNVVYAIKADVAATGSFAAKPLTAGKTQLVTYVRSSGVGTLYIDGVSAGTITDAVDYSAAISKLGATASQTYPWTGYLSALIYNRALSASEVVALYEAGAPSGADYGTPSAPASNTALTFATFGNYQYDTFTGASGTGFTAVETGGLLGVATAYATGIKTAKGKRYLLTFNATLTSGSVPYVVLKTNTLETSAQNIVTSGANSFVLVAGAGDAPDTSADISIAFVTVANTSYAISGMALKPLGLLLAPDAAQPGGGLTWYDASGNSANITLPSTGVSWAVPSSRVLGGNWTTSGNLTVSGGTISSGVGNTLLLQQANYGGGLSANASGQVIVAAYNSQPLRLQTQSADVVYLTSGGNALIGTTTDGGQKLQVNGVLAVGTTGGDRITLSSVAATDQYFFAQNYWNDNGTESVTTSARGSWRAVMRNATSNTFNIDWRAANAAAGTFTNLLSLDSSGNATFAGSVTTVGRVLNTSVKTANYTVATSNHVIICNSASAFTITMIAASSNTGRQFIIKNKGAGEITVDATSLGQIDGLNTITLSQYQSTMLVSDGTTWNRI